MTSAHLHNIEHRIAVFMAGSVVECVLNVKLAGHSFKLPLVGQNAKPVIHKPID